MKYIYHHLGLGDHIICNGLVRYFYEKYESLGLFCYHHNLTNLKYMYSDLKNLTLIPSGSDFEIGQNIYKNNLDVIKIGFSDMNRYYNTNSFDEAFYLIANVPYKYRFEKFYLERDVKRENEVFLELNPNKEPYIFVHDDKDRGFLIDEKKHRNDIKIIKNNKKYTIFELMMLFENAEEIHFMESSISALLGSAAMERPKFYLHRYVRNYDEFGHAKSLNKIEVIY